MPNFLPPSNIRGAGDIRGPLERHIRDLQQAIAQFVVVQEFVKARDQDLAGGTIGTTEAVEQTATLTIPNDWNSYDIEGHWTGRLAETGTLTATRSFTMRLKLTNPGGAQLGTNIAFMNSTSPTDRGSLGVVGFITGQTVKGSVAVVLTGQASGDNNQASWLDGTLIVTAYRTS
jgi:hypothetical protein